MYFSPESTYLPLWSLVLEEMQIYLNIRKNYDKSGEKLDSIAKIDIIVLGHCCHLSINWINLGIKLL